MSHSALRSIALEEWGQSGQTVAVAVAVAGAVGDAAFAAGGTRLAKAGHSMGRDQVRPSAKWTLGCRLV